ncbi:hypothetical protein ALP54_04127 [Pseudomonas amygdali pv. lachrymans]|nr:hypothetical protein ALP54_04127 [Pseudomonas amygdali pv. lachrymans]
MAGMSGEMTLERLHELHRMGGVNGEALGAHWDEISPRLLVAPPTGDIHAMVEWARQHQHRAALISDLFSTTPSLAFENDRLGLLVLLGTHGDFRSNLLRYFLIDHHPEIPRQMTCQSYAEAPSDTLLGECWQGTVVAQFRQMKVNPFQGDFYISRKVADELDRDDVLYLVSALRDSVIDSLCLTLRDQGNLGILLSATALMGQSALIVGQCRDFWDAVAEVGLLQQDASFSSMGGTFRSVIGQTSSYDLYQEISRSHADIAAHFPIHQELLILSDLTDGHCPVRPDDNPDFPTFTLERVLGKSVTTGKTQAWLLSWLDKCGAGKDGIDCLDEQNLYEAVLPLLVRYRQALMGKPSLFNPDEFTESEILRDIQAGRYFRVACRAFLNEPYRKALSNLPLGKILYSESSWSEIFCPMLGPYFQQASDERIIEAYVGCRSIKNQLDFLCDLYRERFLATPPGFLLRTCKGVEGVGSLLKEMEQRKIPMPAGVILRGHDIDPAVRDEFLSRDIGL